MVTDIARYYMLLSGAPPSFWPYAVTHASTALNLVTHGKSKIPPLEVITGCRQRVMKHLPFGCAAVVTKQVRERDNSSSPAESPESSSVARRTSSAAT